MHPSRLYLIILFALVGTCITPVAFSQVGSLKKTKINKEITMKLPTGFEEMSGPQRRQKYVSDREPVAMYTSYDGLVDFGINNNSSQWSTGELTVLRDFYRSGILNLYDDVDFYQDTTQTINGREYIVFEFRGTLYGKEGSFKGNQALSKYIYIIYTLVEDRILLFNLSAPYQMRNEWRPVAREMMTSIQVK